MAVDLDAVEINIREEPIAFSLLNMRTWFWWRPKRFRVQYKVPAHEQYEVSECYGIPQYNQETERFECILLTTFKRSTKDGAKLNSFLIDLACPSSIESVAFGLAVQVKHGMTVRL